MRQTRLDGGSLRHEGMFLILGVCVGVCVTVSIYIITVEHKISACVYI